MNIKKFLKLPIQYHRNIGLVWKYGGVVRKIGLIHLLIPALLIPATVVTITQTPNIRLAGFNFSKPKAITQSATVLSANIQSAIQNLAVQEIKAESANATLTVNTLSNSTQTSQSGLIQPLVSAVQEVLTTNPIDKAKLRLTNIDRQIIELQTLLEKDKSDRAVERAVNLIKTIGQETGQVVSDPKVQSDREVLTSLIQQYNRLQLVTSFHKRIPPLG